MCASNLAVDPGTAQAETTRDLLAWEGALVDAAADGDAAAFAALYDRHVDGVYRQVHYLVGARVDAEDLTQQVFLNAWRAIARYRRTGPPFRAWLATIAHNTVIDHFRRARPADDLDEAHPASDRWGDPEASALAGHDRAAVRRAVRRLKPDQQRVVLMRFLDGLEYAAVAAALGKSEGNVRVIAHRALAELRRLLAPQVGTP